MSETDIIRMYEIGQGVENMHYLKMIVKSTNRVDETEGSLKGKSMRTISK